MITKGMCNRLARTAVPATSCGLGNRPRKRTKEDQRRGWTNARMIPAALHSIIMAAVCYSQSRVVKSVLRSNLRNPGIDIVDSQLERMLAGMVNERKLVYIILHLGNVRYQAEASRIGMSCKTRCINLDMKKSLEHRDSHVETSREASARFGPHRQAST